MDVILRGSANGHGLLSLRVEIAHLARGRTSKDFHSDHGELIYLVLRVLQVLNSARVIDDVDDEIGVSNIDEMVIDQFNRAIDFEKGAWPNPEVFKKEFSLIVIILDVSVSALKVLILVGLDWKDEVDLFILNVLRGICKVAKVSETIIGLSKPSLQTASIHSELLSLNIALGNDGQSKLGLGHWKLVLVELFALSITAGCVSLVFIRVKVLSIVLCHSSFSLITHIV